MKGIIAIATIVAWAAATSGAPVAGSVDWVAAHRSIIRLHEDIDYQNFNIKALMTSGSVEDLAIGAIISAKVGVATVKAKAVIGSIQLGIWGRTLTVERASEQFEKLYIILSSLESDLKDQLVRIPEVIAWLIEIILRQTYSYSEKNAEDVLRLLGQ